jgi:hypothetical protein
MPLPAFDHYTFRARLQPALVTLLPLALAVVAWAGPKQPWMTALWTLAGSTGATFLLAMAVRNRGKEREPDLWASWGGCPTTQLLRHHGPANSVLRERWHKSLSRLLSITLPTAAEETADSARADEIYEGATRALIAKRRAKATYPLLYNENVFYGFCRNLYAMRTVGIVLSTAGALASFTAGWWFASRSTATPIPWVCAAACCLLLWCWLARINAAWVRVPAFAYAQRLFETTESSTRARATTTTATPSSQ